METATEASVRKLQVENVRPPEFHRAIVLGDMIMPGATPGAAAVKSAGARRFRAAGKAVIGTLAMGKDLDGRKRRDAQRAPDRELQELLQGVDAQLYEVVMFRSTNAGTKRAERLLHDSAGCDGEVAACVALLSSRAISTSHRHDEVVRMIKRFSSDAAGNEVGKPPPLGKTYDDPVAEYWDVVLIRGTRALLRECLCTQHSRDLREQRLQRVSNWFEERSRNSRLAGDIMATGTPKASKDAFSSRTPEPEEQVRPRIGGSHGVTWLCGNNMGVGSPYTPRNSPATHSMGRMPNSARMTLER
eukprot:COSAG02_NODE_9397_length_2229_cov_242.601804_1_plen_302_part_00